MLWIRFAVIMHNQSSEMKCKLDRMCRGGGRLMRLNYMRGGKQDCS